MLYRIFQKDRAKGFQVRLPGREKLPRGQTPAKQVPVLPVSEMSSSGNGERSGTHGFAKRSPRQTTVQTKNPVRVITAQSACIANHITRPGSRRH